MKVAICHIHQLDCLHIIHPTTTSTTVGLLKVAQPPPTGTKGTASVGHGPLETGGQDTHTHKHTQYKRKSHATHNKDITYYLPTADQQRQRVNTTISSCYAPYCSFPLCACADQRATLVVHVACRVWKRKSASCKSIFFVRRTAVTGDGYIGCGKVPTPAHNSNGFFSKYLSES